MTDLSNSLADLAERVKAANEESAAAEHAFIEKALVAGRLLCEAKESCAHGEWTSFLDRASVHERQARRLMQLARSGIAADTVSELGGIKAALDYLSKRKLPATDETLIIGCIGWHEAETPHQPVVFVTPAAIDGYFNVLLFDKAADTGEETARPIRGEAIKREDGSFFSPVWYAVDEMLPIPASERQFSIVRDELLEDDCPFLTDAAANPMPLSYTRAVQKLRDCEGNFTPETFLDASQALSVCLDRMKTWPDDPRMTRVFTKIASERELTRLAESVSIIARADLLHRKLAGEQL
jgi:hypothetical protein